jgi:hypothetical protein
MIRRWLVSAFLIIVVSCTTANIPKGFSEIRKDTDEYSIRIIRKGCKLRSAKIHSRVSLKEESHIQLAITSIDGKIIAYFGLECDGVKAGGNAECKIQSYNSEPPEKLAGFRCTGWANYSFTGGLPAPITAPQISDESEQPPPPLPRHRPSGS